MIRDATKAASSCIERHRHSPRRSRPLLLPKSQARCAKRYKPRSSLACPRPAVTHACGTIPPPLGVAGWRACHARTPPCFRSAAVARPARQPTTTRAHPTKSVSRCSRLAPANPRPPRRLLPTPPRSSIQPRAHPAPTAPTECPAPKDRPRQSSLLHGRRTAQVGQSSPPRPLLTPPPALPYRRCAMQCPHHSNRLCPAHRSRPRPDHQPYPPPSPCESHPRHRAAVFQTSATSCGAKHFQHAGRGARTANQRTPRESNLIPTPSTVAALSAVRQRARRGSHHGAQNGLCRVPRPPTPEKMARVARRAYRARALSGTPSRSRPREEHAARFACPLSRLN